MTKIKLIAFDFDGTILEEGLVIPEETRILLEEIVDLGIKISTASGRKLEEQYMILQKNSMGDSKGWPHFLVVDESKIYILNNGGYEPFSVWNEFVHQGWIKVYPEARAIAIEEFERLKRDGINAKLHIIDQEAIERNLVGIRFDEVEYARAFEEYLARKLQNNKHGLWCNRNYRLVQILPKSAGKGITIYGLSRYLDIHPEEVLVIGDAGNDLDMLNGRFGFYSAAVSNAEPRVIDVVRGNRGYIASQPISKGVTEIIRNIIWDKI
ncbi:MAG: HAD family hydrolase [bacterium]